MYIPKWALLTLTFAGAGLAGWMLRTSMADPSAPVAAASGVEVATPPTTAPPTPAPPAPAPPAPAPPVSALPAVPTASAPIYLTVVNNIPSTAPSVTPTACDPPTVKPVVDQRPPPPTPRREPVRRALRAAPPTSARPSSPRSAAPAATPPQTLVQSSSGNLTINANGDHIVIAAQGAIVAVGDNPVVHANTGDATGSSAITIDANDTAISTGDSHVEQVQPLEPDPSAPLVALRATGSERAPAMSTGATASDGGESVVADRAVAIAGMEDHSIDVGGSDNIVTYDDSNVLVDRDGVLNSNTGDTDTSGLNVVDANRSTVRTGASGNTDESPDDPALGTVDRAPALTGGTGPAASVADVNGVSTANGADSLVIGGDGVDDNGVTVRGDRNVVTYDDGNVVVGGRGDVNAQIGDSDTSGAVVMGVDGSLIETGDSFLPPDQQAGAQPTDPFDGDDPDLSLD